MELYKIKVCSLSTEELAKEITSGKRPLFGVFNDTENNELVSALQLAGYKAGIINKRVTTNNYIAMLYFKNQYIDQKVTATLSCPKLTKKIKKIIADINESIKIDKLNNSFGFNSFSKN